ncbi:hypothetical protein LXL04_033518 [Taraxacum kok-saghyz]
MHTTIVNCSNAALVETSIGFVLQLGSDTSLPGLVAAKVGAYVVLTDDSNRLEVLENMRKVCELNNIKFEVFTVRNLIYVSGLLGKHPNLMEDFTTFLRHGFLAGALPYTVFQPQALELCARKVATSSGDMRNALGICRGAIERLETELRDDTCTSNLTSMVRFDHMAIALSRAYKSPIVRHNSAPSTTSTSKNHKSLQITNRGINEYLHWLPVSVHKQIYYIIRLIYTYSKLLFTNKGSKVKSLTGENSNNIGLSSILEADVRSIVTMARGTAEKDGPLLVVACGRDTISISSSIKRLASDNVFDLVIAPQHDYYALTPHAQEQVPKFLRKYITPNEPPNKNMVLTLGSLHQVDSAALRSAAIAWHDEFASFPKPLIVVNIGGPTNAKQLTSYLRGVLDTCGSIASFVRKELGEFKKIYIWDGEEPNPHMGHLAWADAFIVTADSVSMISEACSTGKPVYVIGGDRCKWKLSEFHKTLNERGLVRPFTGLEDASWFTEFIDDVDDMSSLKV